MSTLSPQKVKLICSQYLKTLSIQNNFSPGEEDKLYQGIVNAANKKIETCWGGKDPSPFKQVASLSIAICGSDAFPSTLASIPGYATTDNNDEIKKAFASKVGIFKALLSIHISIQLLNGAKIGSCSERETLTNKITLSDHYKKDLAIALAIACKGYTSAESTFNFLSLTYESLAYKANPQAQGKPIN